METLEYYQLKDTLGKELRDQIETSISNERELQQKYIGLGVKIAVVGLGAAVVALSIFGIKSAHDLYSAIESIPARIDKRADLEVQKRFDSSANPIPKYESLLRDNAGRAIAASINARVKSPFRSIISLDEGTTASIVDCLNNCALGPTKLLLIDALSTSRIRTVSLAIDQGALSVLANLSTSHPTDSGSIARVIRYFSFRYPERYADDIRKVYEAHSDLLEVQVATAEFVSKIKKDSAQELVKKLANTGNEKTKTLLHFRDLRNGTETQLNAALLRPAIESAFDPNDDTWSIDELIGYLTDIHDDVRDPDEIVGKFVDLIRAVADSKKLTFAAGNFLIEDDEFFGFKPNRGTGISIEQRIHFDTLFNMATNHIIGAMKNTNGEFDESVRQSLAFWLPKAYLDSEISDRHVGFLVVQRTKNPSFTAEDGSQLSIARFADPAILSIDDRDGTPKVVLIWNDKGVNKKSVIIRTSDASALSAFGTWRAPTEDDVP